MKPIDRWTCTCIRIFHQYIQMVRGKFLTFLNIQLAIVSATTLTKDIASYKIPVLCCPAPTMRR